MATGNNQQFYIEALKAIKLQGEQSPVGSDARLLYQTKANSLRETLKKMGYANVDADYGAGVSLANTPGGGKIDWNVLANAADILSTTQAGSTKNAFDRALGEYLTRNLPVWQKASATPSSAITSTSSSVMGGTGAAESIIGGKPIPVSSVNSGMQASQALNTQQMKAAGTWNMGTAGGVEPTATSTSTPTSGTQVYGDFIKSEYFKNNDYEGYFISKTPGIPTIQGDDGKTHIDWANPNMPANMYTLYGNGVGFWNTAQGLSKELLTFDPTAIEKNPAFIEQQKVFTAEMDLLLKQNNLNVDAQLAGLKGSQEANKAALEYELTTIKREIGASNWRSRQSLAASGMAFSGMLGYLYGQNEAKGMDATIRATAISAAEIKAIGEQMAILEGSKLSYKSDLEGLYGAKRAAYRASLIDPSNKRYTEVEGLLDEAIAGMEGVTQMTTPSLAMGQRQEAGAAVQANYELVKDIAKMAKDGVWLTPSADGKSFTFAIGLSDQEQLDRDKFMFDKWYKTEGLNLDWAAQDLNTAKQKFTEWATTQGLNLDSAKLDLEWAKLVETVRSNKAGEAGKISTTTNPDGTPIYDQKPDLSILSNSGASTANLGLANTHLMAGTGAVNADTIGEFMKGTTFYWDATANAGKGAWSPQAPADTKGVKTLTIPGFSSLSQTEMENTLDLIDDPVMAAVAYALYTGKSSEPALRRWQTDNPGFTDEQVQSALAICNKYYGQ